MVQGTGSHVGKSRLCAALCRLFREAGYSVAPFKAQNMSLNAAVVPGGEVARAQVVQAEAAGTEPTVDMNPVLLKPKGDGVAQVIVHGRPVADLTARAYRERFLPSAWEAVAASLERLLHRYEVVVIEGAGSPAEVNLRDGDIANMRVARAAGAPVLLVGDVDRGGVLAAVLGTLALLEREERRLVRGIVVNKFRGDPDLFAPAVAYLERRARRPVLGVLPWLEVGLEEEDSLALEEGRLAGGPGNLAGSGDGAGALDVAAVRFPRLANFDDLEPLRRTAGVRVRLVRHPLALGDPDAIILPGSKNTLADLAFLRRSGLAEALLDRAAAGVPVVGICGGYQMLGETLADPEGREEGISLASAAGEGPGGRVVRGLGLLPVETVFAGSKVQARTEARLLAAPGPLAGLGGTRLVGYEIRHGRTRLRPGATALAAVVSRVGTGVEGLEATDGCVSRGGDVVGTYLHGAFENQAWREAWLAWVRLRRAGRLGRTTPPSASLRAGEAWREAEFARLSRWLRGHLRLDLLEEMVGLSPGALGEGRRDP